jgi:DNA-binding transcriptional ArsR family regulator
MRICAYLESIMLPVNGGCKRYLVFALAKHATPAIVGPMSEIREELYQLHASVCKGFADPKRLILINALRDGERSVTELCEVTQIHQANASQHLAILKSKGLVSSRREGQRVYYKVTSPKINEALDLLLEVMAEQLTIPAM